MKENVVHDNKTLAIIEITSFFILLKKLNLFVENESLFIAELYRKNVINNFDLVSLISYLISHVKMTYSQNLQKFLKTILKKFNGLHCIVTGAPTGDEWP